MTTLTPVVALVRSAIQTMQHERRVADYLMERELNAGRTVTGRTPSKPETQELPKEDHASGA